MLKLTWHRWLATSPRIGGMASRAVNALPASPTPHRTSGADASRIHKSREELMARGVDVARFNHCGGTRWPTTCADWEVTVWK